MMSRKRGVMSRIRDREGRKSRRKRVMISRIRQRKLNSLETMPFLNFSSIQCAEMESEKL